MMSKPACSTARRIPALILAFATAWLTLSYVRADEIPPPPYFVSGADALVIGVAYDEPSIRRMVPDDLKLVPGATGQVIMYTAPEAYGLSAFSGTYAAIDLAGFDAPNGAKARWMVTGLYGPGGVSEALARYFHYPVREGSTILKTEGRKLIAVATMGGRTMIRAEMLLKDEPCQRGAGLIHEVSRRPQSTVTQLIQVPYLADWCPAESAKIEILAPTDDPIAKIQPVKVVWAGRFRGGFGWSLAPNGQ